MTTTLEEALAAICAEHDLTSFAVMARAKPVSTDFAFSATCHWDGFSRKDNPCASNYGADIKSAVANVLSAMREDRTDIPTLPAFEVAA